VLADRQRPIGVVTVSSSYSGTYHDVNDRRRGRAYNTLPSEYCRRMTLVGSALILHGY